MLEVLGILFLLIFLGMTISVVTGFYYAAKSHIENKSDKT